MRRSAIGIGFFLVTALLAGAAAAQPALLPVSQHPELVPYATALQSLLQRSGKVCDEVVEINAFPAGVAVEAVGACSGGQRYEVRFEGAQVQITQL